MEQSNTHQMISQFNLNRITKHEKSLIAEIQDLKIFCFLNKHSGSWAANKARLDSLKFDLDLVRDLMRKMNNQINKSPIEIR